MDINNILQNLAIWAIPVVLAITIHEAAHGYAARYFGDRTAEALGRISLNPLRHIDPVGTVLMPLGLYFLTSGAFTFGYAKPVPVRADRLRNPKGDMVWVAFAGPASNFVQAFLWGVLLVLGVDLLGIESPWWNALCQAGVVSNIALCVLNLFPLPPLDGGRVVTGMLPDALSRTFASIEPFGFFIVIGLMVAGVFSQYWMLPLMSETLQLVQLLINPIHSLLR